MTNPAYIGRERRRGNISAKQYKFNVDQCRNECHESLVQVSIDCFQMAASTLLQTFIRHQAAETIRGGFEQPGNNSNKEQFISTMSEPTATQIDLETEEDVDLGSDVQPYCDEALIWDLKDATASPLLCPVSPLL
ncbi:hypothetical protein BGZ89_007514 [Linnemannia elongata]|nr:hypothetical protein BGZ89_007514 [Linnemannia elongata]